MNLAAVSASTWLLVWVGASIIYRLSHGKPVLFFGVGGASFQERTASGRSNRNWLRQLGGARNCLVVAVVGDRVVIRPWFPFTLMFLPEIYRLEYDLPVSDVLEARTRESVFRRRVELSIRNSAGESESLTLHLREPETFLAAMGRQSQFAAVAGA